MSGINLKFLGDLRRSCNVGRDTERYRKYILEEMICRTIKSLVREKLNDKLDEHWFANSLKITLVFQSKISIESK